MSKQAIRFELGSKDMSATKKDREEASECLKVAMVKIEEALGKKPFLDDVDHKITQIYLKNILSQIQKTEKNVLAGKIPLLGG